MLLAAQISRPGAPSREDMRYGCARACQHGLPCVEMSGSWPELQGRLVVVLVAGFRRCSGALLRERRSYDIWGE
ncbi:unnamed protein product [Prunus armeniaca]